MRGTLSLSASLRIMLTSKGGRQEAGCMFAPYARPSIHWLKVD